jgi:hypothetical protein
LSGEVIPLGAVRVANEKGGLEDSNADGVRAATAVNFGAGDVSQNPSTSPSMTLDDSS